ncbi:MAG: hypothetical protein G8237_05385 [Magnetococcales bacterium]|nr:hypothetical protein [Magnetococcales bacterium]
MRQLFIRKDANSIILLGILLTLNGYGSIPDLKPFTAATKEIHSGIANVGNEYKAAIPDDLVCTSTICAEEFKKQNLIGHRPTQIWIAILAPDPSKTG